MTRYACRSDSSDEIVCVRGPHPVMPGVLTQRGLLDTDTCTGGMSCEGWGEALPAGEPRRWPANHPKLGAGLRRLRAASGEPTPRLLVLGTSSLQSP